MPTLIGSVKTNLGHSEAVSGISSIIKVTLALEHGIIPPTIGIKQINPDLRLSERNVEVVTKPIPWPTSNSPRASVNSFGYGGANAHAIIESAASYVQPCRSQSHWYTNKQGKWMVLPFSAHGKPALLDGVKNIKSFDLNESSIADVAFTLTSHRSLLSNRGYLLIEESRTDHDLSSENVRTLDVDRANTRLPIAFVFTGQGAQWPLMGRELFDAFPIYRRVIQTLDCYLGQLPHPPSWTIESIQ